MKSLPGQRGFIGYAVCVGAMVVLGPGEGLANPMPVDVQDAVRKCIEPNLSQDALRDELLSNGWLTSIQSPFDAHLLMGSHMVVMSNEISDGATDLTSLFVDSTPVWQESAHYFRSTERDADILLEAQWLPLGNNGYRICTFGLNSAFEVNALDFGLPSEPFATEASKTHYQDSSLYGADLIVFEVENALFGVVQVIEASINLAPEAVE